MHTAVFSTFQTSWTKLQKYEMDVLQYYYVFNTVCFVIINIKDKHDKTVLMVNMQLQSINLFFVYTEPDN